MQTIQIADFISNNLEATNAVSQFTKNKLIIKGSTGIGGTSTILAIKDQTIIIVSPLTGMIIGKEQFKKDHQLFIYQNSKDRWSDVSSMLNEGKSFILNTTPEQILELQKNNSYLFNQLLNQKVYIDESHLASEADYRQALGKFMHIVYTQWNNFFILSTATPVYLNLDIPPTLKDTIEIIKIERKSQLSKNIEVFPASNYQNWIIEQVKKGNKVVFFTNDIKIIRNIVALNDITTQTLLGDILQTKAKTTRLYTTEEVHNMKMGIIEDKDVLILSTKFLVGFDVPHNASVGIMANYNEHNKVDNRSINDIVQAYGRVRGKVINSALFYNSNNFVDSISIAEHINSFKQDLGFNHIETLAKYLPLIEMIRTYTDELSTNLFNFGFTLVNNNPDLIAAIPSGHTVSDKLNFLRELDIKDLKDDTTKVLARIAGDDENYSGFNTKFITLFASAYIISIADNKWLDEAINDITHYDRLITNVKLFLDCNLNNNIEQDIIIKYKSSPKSISTAINAGATSTTFNIVYEANPLLRQCAIAINSLYLINEIDSIMSDDDNQKMEITNIVSKEIFKALGYFISSKLKLKSDSIEKIITNSNINKIEAILANRDTKISDITNHLLRDINNSLTFQPNEEQQSIINKKINNDINTIFKIVDDKPFDLRSKLNMIRSTTDKQKENHSNYILGLLSLNVASHMYGFRRTLKDDREYNVATKVPKFLRKYTPYEMIEIDIKSANAQIVDQILGTNIALDVYQTLMIKFGISRTEAKVKYNATLNNYKLPVKKAEDIYFAAGYIPVKAKELAKLTSGNKIFYLMTKNEARIMKEYQMVARMQNYIRVHDSYIVMNIKHHQNIPSKVNGVEFGITIF